MAFLLIPTNIHWVNLLNYLQLTCPTLKPVIKYYNK